MNVVEPGGNPSIAPLPGNSAEVIRRLPKYWRVATILVLLLLAGVPAQGQIPLQTNRDFLLQHMGLDVLVLDTTSGPEQFVHEDASLTYRATLSDVQEDYFVITRNVEGDRRSFIYSLALVRRITIQENGKPLNPIVIELY